MSVRPRRNFFTSHSERDALSYLRYSEDEISLIDLWLVLVRRRHVLAAATAFGLAAAIVYVSYVPPKYKYTTTIEIGSQITGDKVVPIESPDSVRAKIAESYIPLVVQAHEQLTGEEAEIYEIEVTAPNGSQVLILSSKGTKEQDAVYKELHKAVVERLQKDHSRVSNVLRKGFEIEIAERERKIASLKEQSRVLLGRIKRIEEERALFAQEIKKAEELLTNAERDRDRALKEVTTATRAMTLLLISEQLNNNQGRLTELKTRWAIELPNQREELEKYLADNRRAEEDELAEIDSLSLALSGMQETRAVSPPIRLTRPVGLDKPMIVFLALLLGLTVGVLVAFLMEFLSKAKSRMNEGQGSQILPVD